MSNNKILDAVTVFTDRAHGDQLRKYGSDRYIVHPVRVMKNCARYTTDVCVLSAALLHDVLEDTAVTQDELLKFLQNIFDRPMATRTLSLVIELTDIYTRHNYPRMNRRNRKAQEAKRLSQCSADAQTIKYADIHDNAQHIMDEDPDFGPIFLREAFDLLTQLTRGNATLHAEAIDIVQSGLNFRIKKNLRTKS
ncbi:MAG TPA: HD domain-containing protein [Ohtaekwangia sp.]|nr:HD domain-containing protein [Ohtaekwangia sp.]